jgi:hypothetical protein
MRFALADAQAEIAARVPAFRELKVRVRPARFPRPKG